MNRRELLKIGAALSAWPALAQADWTPAFFSAHQNDVLIEFSDIMIPATDTPGAKEALVNRFIDKILAASEGPVQSQFVADLETFDRYAGDMGKFTVEQSAAFNRLKGWTVQIYYATKEGDAELNKGGRVPTTFGCTTG